MKKLFYVLGVLTLIVSLSGCGKDKPKETNQVSYSGVFVSYQTIEDKYYVNIDIDGIPQTIQLSDETVIDQTIAAGYEVTVYGEQYVDGSGELATSIVVDKVPLDVELGYDGGFLMSKESDTMYQSLLAKVSYDYTISNNGRTTTGSENESYYIDQDEKAIYINIVGNDVMGSANVAWSSMEYIDRLTGDDFYLYNYGSWLRRTADNTEKITFAVPEDSVIVEEFYREGSNLVVIGGCSIVSGTYLDYLLIQTVGEVYKNSNASVSFVAKFDEVSSSLFYAEYLISFPETLSSDDGVVTVNNLSVVLTGVDFNNSDSVVIPDYVRNFVAEREETSDEVLEDVKLYQSVFGVSAEEVTTDWVVQILGNPYENQDLISVCNPDDVVAAGADIILNYNMDQLVSLMNSDNKTIEQQFALNEISYFLTEGVE